MPHGGNTSTHRAPNHLKRNQTSPFIDIEAQVEKDSSEESEEISQETGQTSPEQGSPVERVYRRWVREEVPSEESTQDSADASNHVEDVPTDDKPKAIRLPADVGASNPNDGFTLCRGQSYTTNHLDSERNTQSRRQSPMRDRANLLYARLRKRYKFSD